MSYTCHTRVIYVVYTWRGSYAVQTLTLRRGSNQRSRASEEEGVGVGVGVGGVVVVGGVGGVGGGRRL